MERKERFTTPGEHYTAKQLRMLQAFEDRGWLADEITPKGGSPAALNAKPQQKYKIKLIKGTTLDGRKPRYTIVVDGEEMSVNQFAAMIGEKANTVRWWCSHNTFDRNMRERGLV